MCVVGVVINKHNNNNIYTYTYIYIINKINYLQMYNHSLIHHCNNNEDNNVNPSNEHETFEPLDISPEQQIYNPIFDEFPPKYPHYLDLEQYIAVKRTIPKEWNITGIPNIPIISNSNSNNDVITSNTKRTNDYPQTPRGKDNYDMDTLSSGSNNLRTTASPFWYANRIVLPQLPQSVRNKPTPFQLLQHKFNFIKGLIEDKKALYLNKHCDLKLTNLYNNGNSNSSSNNTSFTKRADLRKIRLKKIGSYSNIYYNKLGLQKVETMRNKNNLPDYTYKGDLFKLNNNKQHKLQLQQPSSSYSNKCILNLSIIKCTNMKGSVITNKKNGIHYNNNNHSNSNSNILRNLNDVDSIIRSISPCVSSSNINNINTSQTGNDCINKSEFQLKGNKKYL